MPLLAAFQLKLDYADVAIFSDVTLQVNDEAKIGIVGPNGVGKTSLLKVLIGQIEPTSGSVFKSQNIRIGYVPQISNLDSGGSLREMVMTAFSHLQQMEADIASSALEIQHGTGQQRHQAELRYASLISRYEALGGYDYMSLLDQIVAGVGLPVTRLETPLAACSGGERTRAALATALLKDPDVLILDEPTTYLDFRGLNWLEDYLRKLSRSYLVVSHDRYFLDKVTKETWEMTNTRLKAYKGNYTKYVLLRDMEDQRRSKEYQRQQAFIAKEEHFIQRYHAGQRSREARGRATRLARLKRIDSPQVSGSVVIDKTTTARTGHIVLRTSNLKVGYHEGKDPVELLTVPDIRLERGSRTAIIGSNGIGKTTLIHTLLGEVAPLSGELEFGHNVRLGNLPQGTDNLSDNRTILDNLLDIKNIPIGEARSYLAQFLFREDKVYDLVSSLSGGERNRLSLARLTITQPNVLILDEPTTHLDIPSREALEQMLAQYDGTILLVSHDRHLISMLANHLWILELGQMRIFNGNFEQWVAEEQTNNTATAIPGPRAPDSSAGSLRTKRSRTTTSLKGGAKGKPNKLNHVEIIDTLENKLAEIEIELGKATERQDLREISRLGEEHLHTSSNLDRAMKEWSNQDLAADP